MRTVSRFKGLAFAVCGGLIAAVGALVLLGVLYVGLLRENAGLRRQLTETRQELSALRRNNTILLPHMAALHLPSTAGRHPAPAAEVSAAPSGVGPAQPLSQSASPGLGVDDGDAAPRFGNIDPSSLTIDDFSIRRVESSQTLAVQFTLKNTGSTTNPVSGFVTVVLKDDAEESTGWISIPSVTLSSGRPSAGKKGYPFSIDDSKALSLKAQALAAPERFQSATIFIFDAYGNALFEMDFPIDLIPPPE